MQLQKCTTAKVHEGRSLPWGYDLATVTFANDGSVDKVAIAPPFAGTPTGECPKGTLAAARIAPFAGTPHSLGYRFYVAPQ